MQMHEHHETIGTSGAVAGIKMKKKISFWDYYRCSLLIRFFNLVVPMQNKTVGNQIELSTFQSRKRSTFLTH